MESSGLVPQAPGQHPAHTAKKPEKIFAAVLLGQLLSFLLALTSLISALLASKGVSLPATQTVPNYALLAVVYGVLQLGRRERRQNGFAGYAAVAFLDVEANFLVVMAFRYSFITSVQLLNSFTVPCAFLMSWFVLSAQYKALHCVGAALCLASLALFVYTDSGSSEASDVVLGDGLVIMGAMLYAACNVTQEKLLRKGTTVEVLACMGLFGLFWSSIQAAGLEHEAVRQAEWTPQAVCLLAGYTLTMFAFYSLVPWVLQWSGAAVLNLSLLTSNLWAALARALLLGGFPQKTALAFSGSLFMVSVGLVLFTCGGTVYPKKAPEEERYRVIRFGDSGGSQQGTPRFWRPGTFSGGWGRKVSEGDSEGQPLWWRAGRMSGKDPEKAAKDADKTGGQKDSAGDVGAAAVPAACSPAAHAMPQEYEEKEQGSEFWVSRLPSLPGEGAITADPYSKVGSSVQRSPSTPPAKPPA